MNRFIKTAALLLIISVTVACSTPADNGETNSATADSIRKDSIARSIIRTKDSIARTAAEKTADQTCDTTLIDLIIKEFE